MIKASLENVACPSHNTRQTRTRPLWIRPVILQRQMAIVQPVRSPADPCVCGVVIIMHRQMRWCILIGRHKEHKRPDRNIISTGRHTWGSWQPFLVVRGEMGHGDYFTRQWRWRLMENCTVLGLEWSSMLTATHRYQCKCQRRWKAFWRRDFPTAPAAVRWNYFKNFNKL